MATAALFLTGAGFAVLYGWPVSAALPCSAALFGLGMGLITPALNALAFELAPPQARALAANMMLLTIQLGNFIGPFAGATALARLGSHGFLGCSSLLNLAVAAAFVGVMPRAGKTTAAS